MQQNQRRDMRIVYIHLPIFPVYPNWMSGREYLWLLVRGGWLSDLSDDPANLTNINHQQTSTTNKKEENWELGKNEEGKEEGAKGAVPSVKRHHIVVIAATNPLL